MAEGTDVGIIGGLAVAIWFLILDTNQLVFGAILVYTAFHFAVFALIGMGLVVLVHWAVRDSVVRYALLPVFLVFEVMFYGLLEVLSERTHTLFPFWAVVSANTLAALSMGVYLWVRHPDFRRSIRDTPLGDAPRLGKEGRRERGNEGKYD